LKGSKHSCGFAAPPDDKNPAAIFRNLLFHSIQNTQWAAAQPIAL